MQYYKNHLLVTATAEFERIQWPHYFSTAAQYIMSPWFLKSQNHSTPVMNVWLGQLMQHPWKRKCKVNESVRRNWGHVQSGMNSKEKGERKSWQHIRDRMESSSRYFLYEGENPRITKEGGKTRQPQRALKSLSSNALHMFPFIKRNSLI